MLKYYLVLCCAAFTLAEDKYTDKYDKIDLDEILGNKRLLQAYVNCILDKGKCTPEGKELKGKTLINSIGLKLSETYIHCVIFDFL